MEAKEDTEAKEAMVEAKEDMVVVSHMEVREDMVEVAQEEDTQKEDTVVVREDMEEEANKDTTKHLCPLDLFFNPRNLNSVM